MPVEDLTRDLKEMMRLASLEEGLEPLFDFGLDWVDRLAPYDLATIFFLEENELVVRAARGRLDSPKIREHTLPLAEFPSIKRVLENRRARTFTENDHAHGDGDPFDGVLDLPHGHACMVVPLCSGKRTLGVLTLDRAFCEPYSQQTVDLLEIYGQVLAMAILLAEQNSVLRRLHLEARERERLLVSELRGDPLFDIQESNSLAVREMARRVAQVAQTHTPVLILGETGVGKERVADAIHRLSSRAAAPFLKINCAAIPENLLESELFGHVKGAFTGAARGRPGRFQMANGGTILLDEIGEMPLAVQAKLLRVLQEGTIDPVGSDRTLKVDVRVLAATHVDLATAIGEKRFREDLYYRLNVFPLEVPPLRVRLDDLPGLCESLLNDLAARTGRVGLRVTEEGLANLARHHWPGNVRELGNVLERAAILTRDRELGPDSLELSPGVRLPDSSSGVKVPFGGESEGLATMEEMERHHIKSALQRTRGKIYGEGGAAELLDLKPSTLQSRMKKLGIQRQVVFH